MFFITFYHTHHQLSIACNNFYSAYTHQMPLHSRCAGVNVNFYDHYISINRQQFHRARHSIKNNTAWFNEFNSVIVCCQLRLLLSCLLPNRNFARNERQCHMSCELLDEKLELFFDICWLFNSTTNLWAYWLMLWKWKILKF